MSDIIDLTPFLEAPAPLEGSDLAEHPQDVADREGLLLVEPKADELFIDLDTPGAVLVFESLVTKAREYVPIIETKRTKSKSGNTHVYLQMPGRILTPLERIAWQAALGSDTLRELLSLLRDHLMLDRPPTVFFELPAKEEKAA